MYAVPYIPLRRPRAARIKSRIFVPPSVAKRLTVVKQSKSWFALMLPLWACRCFGGAAGIGYVCDGVVDARPYLSCNGEPLLGYNRIGDCMHATGCSRTDCPNLKKPLLLEFKECPKSPPPPSPPPAPPPRGWCEQIQARTHQWSAAEEHQIANVLTSLVGVILGLVALLHGGASSGSAFVRTSSCLLILSGLGSALHHWWATRPWSHAADIVPMLLIGCVAVMYPAHVLVEWLPLSRRTKRRAATGILFLGLAWGVVMLSAYRLKPPVTPKHKFGYSEMLLITIGAAALCHVVLLALLCCRARKHAGGDGDRAPPPPIPLARLVLAYSAVVVACGLALPGQFLEWPRCPRWLYESGVTTTTTCGSNPRLPEHTAAMYQQPASGLPAFCQHPGLSREAQMTRSIARVAQVSVHAMWHIGVFVAVFHSNALLHVLEGPPHAFCRLRRDSRWLVCGLSATAAVVTAEAADEASPSESPSVDAHADGMPMRTCGDVNVETAVPHVSSCTVLERAF